MLDDQPHLYFMHFWANERPDLSIVKKTICDHPAGIRQRQRRRKRLTARLPPDFRLGSLSTALSRLRAAPSIVCRIRSPARTYQGRARAEAHEMLARVYDRFSDASEHVFLKEAKVR